MVGRYRWRTVMRRRTPWPLVDLGLFAKGPGDCGRHEWYRDGDDLCRCYHCSAGVASSSAVLLES